SRSAAKALASATSDTWATVGSTGGAWLQSIPVRMRRWRARRVTTWVVRVRRRLVSGKAVSPRAVRRPAPDAPWAEYWGRRVSEASVAKATVAAGPARG